MAEIKINAGVWSSVSDEDKAKITEIMRKTNLISEGDSFSPDVSLTKETPEVEPLGIWCEIGCKTAYALAVTACQALIETPPAYVACLIAAEVGKEVCLDECD
ncbi:MAG: hypothetical protein ACK54D_07565 [Pseudanabaena sp.]|jgi:hypothetical protein